MTVMGYPMVSISLRLSPPSSSLPFGFCASSSAKAVTDWLGYAAWRRLVFLCSLRSFMLR